MTAQELTLRTRIEALRASSTPMDVGHAIGVVVALAVELADQHAQGYNFFVYPSALYEGEDGQFHASQASAHPPTAPADIACLPPESAGIHPGSSRQSVYAVGAILYELVTLGSVGAGMARPSELVPGFPPALELILTKALVGDPAHRPDDLKALAQALYQINAEYSVAPPPADIGHLDHEGDFDVDVSLSLLPPAPAGGGQPQRIAMDAPLPPGIVPSRALLGGAAVAPVSARGADDLLSIKSRLEADPHPRYVIVKDGMDHGPFRAVEILQELAAHSFNEEDLVRDSESGTESTIKEHPDFHHFAHHARLGRLEKAEKEAIHAAVTQESRSTMGKTFMGLSVVGGLLALAGVWFVTSRGAKSDEIQVVEEKAANVESEDGLNVKKKLGGGSRGGGVIGKSGGIAQLAGGMSCEGAQATYVEEMRLDGGGQKDLTAGQFQAVLGTGSYLNGCGVPDSMSVSICAAVQNGRAVGVTVSTNPANPAKSSCISSAVRRLSFPSHPKLDVTRTSFAAN